MALEWLVPFIAGFASDAFRSVFLPQSTDWLQNKIPSTRKYANRRNNLEELDALVKLKSLDADLSSIDRLGDPTAVFLSQIGRKAETFKEIEKQRQQIPIPPYKSLTDINTYISMRESAAQQRVLEMIADIKRSGKLTGPQISALDHAQSAWKDYVDAQANFEGVEIRGRSTYPQIIGLFKEKLILDRLAELTEMYNQILFGKK